MEAFTIAGLGALGYMIGRDGTNKKSEHFTKNKSGVEISKNEKPSVDSVYSGKHFNKTIEETIKRANNVLDNNNTIGINEKEIGTDRNIYSRLADIKMNEEQFKHNNMVPFFGSKITQNIDMDNFAQDRLDRYTGENRFYKKKKEVENFGDIKNNFDNVGGQSNTLEFQRSRYVDSKYITNNLPFEQIRVGPGLNQGYTAEPSGGIQQENKREFELPKTVDERRVLTNPKITFEGRTIDGQKGDLPGDIGDVSKNRVSKDFEQTPDMYLQAGNPQNAKETSRPCYNMKPTHRSDLSTRTVQNNVVSAVESITAPLLDIMKISKKEYAVTHPRTFGNFQNTNPSKITIYDPNDIARTTIKEQQIHDSTLLNFKSTQENTIAYNPEEYVARTTIRETTESKGKTGNVGNLQQGDAYKYIKVDAKDTNKQYTSDKDYYGIGESAADKQMLYDDKYNATINEVKEILLKERKPTKTSVKVFNQIDNMNLLHKKVECDQKQTRENLNYNNVHIETPTIDRMQVTKDKTVYKNDYRFEPNILSQLDTNPYARSINTV